MTVSAVPAGVLSLMKPRYWLARFLYSLLPRALCSGHSQQGDLLRGFAQGPLLRDPCSELYSGALIIRYGKCRTKKRGESRQFGYRKQSTDWLTDQGSNLLNMNNQEELKHQALETTALEMIKT